MAISMGLSPVMAVAKASVVHNRSTDVARAKPSPGSSVSLNLRLAGMDTDGPITRQIFPIRSYEVGADRNSSVDTFIKHFQEISITHLTALGLSVDGFGTTPEMSKRDLAWVTTRMHVVVDSYPSWGDVVEVEYWSGPSGKNGIKRDWEVRDFLTGNTIARASSVIVMMNKVTRKLSKMPEEVKAEIDWLYVYRNPIIVEENIGRIEKLNPDAADCIREGFAPHWSDLDMNGHVNNVKYINWIIESIPESVLETCELVEMKLEYRRECLRDSVLKSFTSVEGNASFSSTMKCHHLLQLENGSEIMRGWTCWRPKLDITSSLDHVFAPTHLTVLREK